MVPPIRSEPFASVDTRRLLSRSDGPGITVRELVRRLPTSDTMHPGAIDGAVQRATSDLQLASSAEEPLEHRPGDAAIDDLGGAGHHINQGTPGQRRLPSASASAWGTGVCLTDASTA